MSGRRRCLKILIWKMLPATIMHDRNTTETVPKHDRNEGSSATKRRARGEPSGEPIGLLKSSAHLSHKTTRYCWRTYFKVLEVPFLRDVFSAFLPSKQACRIHRFRHLGVGQQYPTLFCDNSSLTQHVRTALRVWVIDWGSR